MTPQRFHILLVDDSESEAHLFQDAMREVAPRVTFYWVATVQEALDALGRRERFQDVLGFDIVITDLNMFPMDGFQLLQRVREAEQTANIPVLVMSSSRAAEDIQRAYRCGANSYFCKPMTLEGTLELAACIARHWLELALLPPAAPPNRA